MSMMDLMRNLPQMMQRMEAMQETLRETRVEGSAGGGMVRAEMNGAGELVGLSIEPSAIDPAEAEMLEDLVVAAVADAKRKAGEAARTALSEATGGVDLASLGIRLPGLT